MKALQWAVASLALSGIAQIAAAQVPTPAPPPPPANGAPMITDQAPNAYDAALQSEYGAYQGGPSGSPYPISSGTAAMDPACPPVFGRVASSGGTFFVRGEALMLRRSQPLPNMPLVRTNAGVTALSTGDLHFRQEVGQKMDAGYEFNDCATIMFTWWEVQNWNPTNGIVSPISDLTLFGVAGADSSNFTNAASMQATYSTQIMNYEINWLNATVFDRWSLLGGFRYLDIIDQLGITSTRNTGAANLQGTSDYIMRTTDRLLGGQIGAMFKYDIDLWSFEFTGKSGLYDNSSQFNKTFGDVNNTVIVDPQTAPPVANNLAAVNEMNLSFSRKLTNHFAVRAGYNVMWITDVVLASDQFDPTTGQVNRQFIREGGDLFLYGVNLGVDGRF